MNAFHPRIALAAMLFAASLAWAGPGAHGPNGEHLDGQAPVLSAGPTVPRAEAKSESFELVARVEHDTLAIFVDRYETNEPVLDATLEVESGPVKAKAEFRREQGDYAVRDAQMLKLLATPGSHALVFTIATPKDGDLLEGAMVVGAPVVAESGRSWTGFAAVLAALAVAGIAAAFLLHRRRHRRASR